MDNFFIVFLVILISTLFVLFFPLLLDINIYLDYGNRLNFSLRLFNFIKLIGGYIVLKDENIVLHISNKKAIIKPIINLKDEKLEFDLIKNIKFISFKIMTLSGAEYVYIFALIHNLLKVFYNILRLDKERFASNLYIIDKNLIKVCIKTKILFNIWIIVNVLFSKIKENKSVRKQEN